MLSVSCLLAGCQSPRSAPPSATSTVPSTRNNCYSLLHQLLEQQKDVSLLRFIKPEHPDVKVLIKRIAAASGAGSKMLEEFAKNDPALSLNDLRLPPGEVATRDAIAATEKKELLGQAANISELTLLLTQIEALNYASHLAKVGGQNDPQPARARAMADLSSEMAHLYNEVFVLLLSKTK